MMKKKNKYLITSFLLLLFTGFYIFALKNVDVQPIGPQGTEVGFATLNKAVADRLVFNPQWYRITKYLGYAAFAVVGVFVLCGLIQLIRRRSLSGVDRKFYALAGLYAVTAILYVTFEHVIINYRPVIMPDNTVPEASFPSTHTLIACVVMGSTCIMVDAYIHQSALRLLLKTLCILVLLVTVAGRLLSGVHWLTDIFGGLLISAVLLTAFHGVIHD